MGRKRSRRRKSSDDSVDNGPAEKRERQEKSPGGVNTSVADLLKETNSVLYGDDQDQSSILEDLFKERKEDSRPDTNIVNTKTFDMAENVNNVNKKGSESQPPEQPTNADLLKCLTQLNEKLVKIDGRLDEVHQKVGSFEQEFKKLWAYVHEQEKKMSERMSTVEESLEGADFNLSVITDKVSGMEKKQEELREEIVYLQSQSMRNNLIFSKIPEAQSSASSEPEDSEKVIREFMVQKMKIAQEIVNNIRFERVHRMGQRREGRARNIVAKFTLFKERELVRRQSVTLKGTGHFVFEQFPQEVNERRRKLLPRMKEEQRKGNRAWLSYDTLYVNGRPVRDSS